MKNKNIPLIIGIAIPFIFILIFAGFVYIPKVTINPQYDFIYTQNRQDYNHAYLNDFKVVDGRIEKQVINLKRELDNVIIEEYPDIYLYDIEAHTSKIISLEVAEELILDPGPSSPDGYVVDYQYGHNGIFEIFGDNDDDRGYYIGDGKSWKKLLGLSTNDRYYRDLNLIGWIK